MSNRTRHLLLTALAALLAAPVAAPSADAAPAEEVRSWTVTPAGDGGIATRSEFAYQVDPGTSVDDAVTVYNLGNTQLTFRVYAADGTTTDDGSFTVAPGDVEPVGAGSWVTLAQELVTIPAGQQVTIPLTVEVPANATPGDHAAGIVATVYEDRVSDPNQPVDVEFRTGTRMYLRVNGAARASLSITSLAAEYDAGASPFDGSVDVTFRVRNAGTLRLAGTATVKVRGLLGIGERTVELPPLEELLPGGDYTVTARIDDMPAALLLDTEVVLVPDAVDGAAGAPTVQATTRTIAVPWSLLLLLAVVVLLVLTAGALRRHRLADRAGARATASPTAGGTW